jgi:predicted metal-dependent hydrolase
MLTNEDLQAVADLTAEAIGIRKRPVIQIKAVHAGRARTKTGLITIPKWSVSERPESYTIAYVVHEVCHFRVRGHGCDFRELEMEALAYWGMKPLYKRAYIRGLRSMNGDALYDEK